MKRSRKEHYPVFLNLAGRTVLLVGDGPLAEGKRKALGEAGARIRRVKEAAFRERHLQGVDLAICASENESLNRKVSKAAVRRRIFVNVVDRPALCSFIAPARVRKGFLQIAISTGGRSPALAVRVKEEIAAFLGDEYGDFLDLLASVRERVFARNPTAKARAKIFHRMVRSKALDLLRDRRPREARLVIEKIAQV